MWLFGPKNWLNSIQEMDVSESHLLLLRLILVGSAAPLEIVSCDPENPDKKNLSPQH